MNAAPPRPRTPVGSASRGRGRVFGQAALLIVGCFVLGYIATTLIFFPGFGRGLIVTVPDLRGRTFESAKRAGEKVGLEIERGSTLPNPRIPAGSVLTQSPLPGQEVTRGSSVRLMVSAGPDRRPVPRLVGLTGDQARVLLERTGFQVRVVTAPNSSPAGRILSVSPQPGQLVPIPGVVQLTLSAGPPRVAVPNIVGSSADEARTQLSVVGLRMGAISYAPSAEADAGSVVAQRPAAGASLASGSAVGVTLAGRDPTPAPVAAPPAAPAAPADTGLVTEAELRAGAPR